MTARRSTAAVAPIVLRLHAMANEEQSAFWNETGGKRWVALGPELEAHLRPFAEDVLARAAIATGERVLDVGCGAGTLALESARRVGASGAVLGVDLSGPLLERARARAAAEGLAAIARFEQADAQTHPFEEASRDAVISRFGVMFFDDPVAAFANLRRALRPGGRLAFAAWQRLQENEWATLPLSVVGKFVPLPPPAPPDRPGPFSLREPERARSILERAGFENVTIEDVRHAELPPGNGDLARAATFLLRLGPASAALREAGVDPSTVEPAMTEALAAMARERGDLRLRAATWIVSAKRGAR